MDVYLNMSIIHLFGRIMRINNNPNGFGKTVLLPSSSYLCNITLMWSFGDAIEFWLRLLLLFRPARLWLVTLCSTTSLVATRSGKRTATSWSTTSSSRSNHSATNLLNWSSISPTQGLTTGSAQNSFRSGSSYFHPSHTRILQVRHVVEVKWIIFAVTFYQGWDQGIVL